MLPDQRMEQRTSNLVASLVTTVVLMRILDGLRGICVVLMLGRHTSAMPVVLVVAEADGVAEVVSPRNT